MNRDQDHPEPSDVLTAGNFFRWKEFSAADAPHHSDTIQRLLDGDLHAAIIRDVYDASILETVVERHDQTDPPFVDLTKLTGGPLRPKSVKATYILFG